MMNQIVTRRVPLRRWQKDQTSDIFIALSIRRPATLPMQPSWGRVRSRRPRLGEYLSSTPSESIPHVPFIDCFTERPAHPLERHVTRVEKLRIVVTAYDPECQPLLLINGGTIFSIVTLWMTAELMEIVEFADYPISLRGGFESH